MVKVTDLFNKKIKSSIYDINTLSEILEHLDTQTKINVISQSALNEAEKMAIITTSKLTEVELEQALAQIRNSTATAANIGFTSKLSLAYKGLAASMGLSTVALSSILAIFAVTAGTVYLIDKFSVSIEDLRNKAEESTQVFKDLSSEIDGLNSELKTSKSRMEELASQPNLSFVEQDELEKLKQTTSELERQIQLKDALKNAAQSTAREDALNYFNANNTYEKYTGFGDNQNNSIYGQSSPDIVVGNQIDVLSQQLNDYKSLVEEKKNLDDSLLEFKANNPENYENYIDFQNMELEVNSLDNAIKALNYDITNSISDMDKFDDSLDIEKDKNLISNLEIVKDLFSSIFNPNHNDITTSFDQMWDSNSFATYKKELIELSKAGKLSPDVISSNDKYKKLLTETGKTAKQVASHINNLVENAGLIKSISPTLQDQISSLNDLSDGFEALDKIYSDIKDKGTFDFSNLADSKFISTFKDMGDVYTDFIETVSNSPTDINACQNAFDKLVGTWLNSTGVLTNLTDENANVTAAMLKNMGVANADEIVTNKLAIAKQYAAIESENHTESIESEIVALINEDGKLTESEKELAQYALAKATANGTMLDTSADINSLIALVQSLGGATEALGAFADAKRMLSLAESSGVTEKTSTFLKEKANDIINQAKTDIQNALVNQSTVSTKPNYTGGTKSNKESSKSTEDAWKKAFEEEKKLLDHNLNMQYITQREYYDRLEVLNNRYFKDRKKYLDEYRQYEEEIFKGMSKVRQDEFNESSSVLEYSVKLVARGENSNDTQTQIYRVLQDNVKEEINWYLSKGLSGTDEIIRNLNEKLWEYQDSEFSIYKSILDDRVDSYKNYVSKCNDYNQWGKDNEIDTWQRLMSEIDKMYAEGKLSAKDYATYCNDVMEKVVDATKSAYETYRDKVVDEIDAKINSLEDKKKNKASYYNSQIDALKKQKDLISEQADELDRALAIEKARIELEKARSNKISIYREGIGLVYEENQTAVDEAQNKLNDLLAERDRHESEKYIEDQIESLESLKDSYEETINAEIEKLKEQKAAWEDSLDFKNEIDSFISNFQELEELEGLSFDKRISKVKAFTQAYLDSMGIVAGNNYSTQYASNLDDAKNASLGSKVVTSTGSYKVVSGDTSGATYNSASGLYTIPWEDIEDSNNKNTDALNQGTISLNDNSELMKENTNAIETNVMSVNSNSTELKNVQNQLYNNSDSISDLIHSNYYLAFAIESLKSSMSVPKNHSGGIVGQKAKSLFNFATDTLKSDELLSVVKEGEVILNEPQISNLYDKITDSSTPNLYVGKTNYSSLPNSGSYGDTKNYYNLESLIFPNVKNELDIQKAMQNLPELATQQSRKVN